MGSFDQVTSVFGLLLGDQEDASNQGSRITHAHRRTLRDLASKARELELSLLKVQLESLDANTRLSKALLKLKKRESELNNQKFALACANLEREEAENRATLLHERLDAIVASYNASMTCMGWDDLEGERPVSTIVKQMEQLERRDFAQGGGSSDDMAAEF